MQKSEVRQDTGESSTAIRRTAPYENVVARALEVQSLYHASTRDVVVQGPSRSESSAIDIVEEVREDEDGNDADICMKVRGLSRVRRSGMLQGTRRRVGERMSKGLRYKITKSVFGEGGSSAIADKLTHFAHDALLHNTSVV